MANDTDALTPDAVLMDGASSTPLDGLFRSLGLPSIAELVTELAPVDPDAVTLDDLAARLDALEETLAPVVELAHAVKANAGKLRRFGLTWPTAPPTPGA